MNSTDDAVRIAAFFENFSREHLARLHEAYTPDARFKDPFHQVRGVAAIEQIYRRMFDTLDEPVFVVTRRMSQGGECWLSWDLEFRFHSMRRHQVQVIHGASHLRLAEDGRIAAHRDYWDAAEELYEKFPVLGPFMRWLKRRASS